MEGQIGQEGAGPSSFGWVLVVAAILATCFAMAHPHIGSKDLSTVLRALARGAVFNGWIHGALMALSAVLVAGFLGFSRRIGLDRPEVVLGMVAYAFGTVAMACAAAINGFALGIFAGRYAALRPEQANAVAASVNEIGSISGAWAGIGAAATSAAIAAWSIRLLAFPGAPRATGLFGGLLAAATLVLLASGTLIMNVHGFLLLVVSQSLWTVAVGLQLARGRL